MQEGTPTGGVGGQLQTGKATWPAPSGVADTCAMYCGTAFRLMAMRVGDDRRPVIGCALGT